MWLDSTPSLSLPLSTQTDGHVCPRHTAHGLFWHHRHPSQGDCSSLYRRRRHACPAWVSKLCLNRLSGMCNNQGLFFPPSWGDLHTWHALHALQENRAAQHGMHGMAGEGTGEEGNTKQQGGPQGELPHLRLGLRHHGTGSGRPEGNQTSWPHSLTAASSWPSCPPKRTGSSINIIRPPSTFPRLPK